MKIQLKRLAIVATILGSLNSFPEASYGMEQPTEQEFKSQYLALWVLTSYSQA
jgi:hypothetical protein